MTDLYLEAAKLKLRFETPRGLLSVEDLFDLPLTTSPNKLNLDDIARSIYKKIHNEVNISFVDETTAMTSSKELQLKMEIVKNVIAIKKAELDIVVQKARQAELEQKLCSLIEQKKDEQLRSKTIEELQAELYALAKP